MRTIHLIYREIAHRKLPFGLGVAAITVAVACLVAEVSWLRLHDLRTDRILAAKAAETKVLMDRLEDDIRKITVKMGFNMVILPQGQTLEDLQNEEQPPRFMPEEYADRLSRSRVATINHVLPTLVQRLKWPERQRKVVLMGVKGEVWIQSASQKPILESIMTGQVVVGYELHRSLKLSLGQKIQLLGREFVVNQLMPERGNADDITLWINLREMQELLNRPQLINAILALECNCSVDRLAKIRQEIGQLLPDTRVIEFASQAIARAEARNRAAEQAASALRQEQNHRLKMRQQQEAFASILIPLVVLAAGAWIGLLMHGNVRERRSEVGILRALGTGSSQILTLFLGKAAAMGFAGSFLGIGLGALVSWIQAPSEPGLARILMNPLWIGITMLAAPGLAMVVSWVPALLAAQQDPATILNES
jgi:putative ABC transport system permease protein